MHAPNIRSSASRTSRLTRWKTKGLVLSSRKTPSSQPASSHSASQGTFFKKTHITSHRINNRIPFCKCACAEAGAAKTPGHLISPSPDNQVHSRQRSASCNNSSRLPTASNNITVVSRFPKPSLCALSLLLVCWLTPKPLHLCRCEQSEKGERRRRIIEADRLISVHPPTNRRHCNQLLHFQTRPAAATRWESTSRPRVRIK